VIRAVVARTLAVLLVAAAWSPRPVRADAVVGTGAPGSCTEAALNAALGCGAPTGSPPRSNCTAGGKLTFNCGGAATITVTSTKTISADTTIDGGSLLTVSGGGSLRVFLIHPGVSLAVANLDIRDGYPGVTGCAPGGTDPACCGGAIENLQGMLTVTDSSFSNNRADEDPSGGAIANYQGTINVDRSTFSGNISGGGGAIILYGGTVTISDSTFVGNSAINGGAIVNAEGGGTINIRNSTFAGNQGRYGGAINNGSGTLTLTNITFSGNSASQLGGAIYNDGAVVLANTIVANSSGAGNCSNGNLVRTATISSGGNNIDSDGTCGLGPATNPLLDPAGLANNGGPTQTIALEPGSPAINAGNETVCAAPPINNLDQRGFGRPGTGATNCSIGAYEYTLPGSRDCCQCPTSCAVPVNGSCGGCTVVFGATCESGQLCVLHTPAPSPTPTATKPSPTPSPTATNTPGTNDCCQCADFCAAPIVGTCGGCAVVFGASCTGGSLCVSRTPMTTPCVGDCNGDHSVTVDEILTMVNIALGNADATACPNGIPSGAQVDVALILTAVNNALTGCFVEPTASPTLTEVPTQATSTETPTASVTPASPTIVATPQPTASAECPQHPPRVFSVQSPTADGQQTIEGCTDAAASGPIRIFSQNFTIDATLTDDPCPPGEMHFRATVGQLFGVTRITVCHTRSAACGPFNAPLCTHFDDAGQPLDVAYTTRTPTAPPTPSPTQTCSGPCPSTPTATPTPTATCAPTGTPYCADQCYPCPTIRAGCYAYGSCGFCIENPHCAAGEVHDCTGSRPYGCCTCATPTISATPTATQPTPTITQSPTPTLTRTPASGRFVYARFAYGLGVVDATSRTLITYVPLSGSHDTRYGVPRSGLAAAPDGRELYVASDRRGLQIVDTTTNTMSGEVQWYAQSLNGIAVTSGGDRLYVNGQVPDATTVIDTATRAVIGTIDGIYRPGDIVLGRVPARAYVASYGAVGVIDGDANVLLGTIPVFGFPLVLAIHPNDAYVYAVSNNQVQSPTAATLFLIDTGSAAVIAAVPLPGPVHDMVLAPDGALAYVTDARAPQVVVLETATWTPIAEIPVDEAYAPDAIAVAPDGHYVYVASGSSWQTLSVIDTATRSVVGTLPLPQIIHNLAVVDVP